MADTAIIDPARRERARRYGAALAAARKPSTGGPAMLAADTKAYGT